MLGKWYSVSELQVVKPEYERECICLSLLSVLHEGCLAPSLFSREAPVLAGHLNTGLPVSKDTIPSFLSGSLNTSAGRESNAVLLKAQWYCWAWGKAYFFSPESMINLEKERNPERSRPLWSQLHAARKLRPTCRTETSINSSFRQQSDAIGLTRRKSRGVYVCAFGLPDEACYEFISTQMRKHKQEWNGYILAYDFKLTTMICKWLQFPWPPPL